jgi:3-isopropylmalate/(R)-2-methylmalate dehydratase large subunit
MKPTLGVATNTNASMTSSGILLDSPAIVPATKEVYEKMLTSGLMTRYFNAGFIISNQGCGGCAAGQIGMTGEGEVQISTSNRNFKGKQGNGETYLASPMTAVASALAGKITPPEVK